ncbi:MAG TPA: hypothetical protein VFC31_01860, partial [Candidatus Limnocylindria bacterium]|nr:hypothetical protein [Candidatus Limnocylindria bacterium]
MSGGECPTGELVTGRLARRRLRGDVRRSLAAPRGRAAPCGGFRPRRDGSRETIDARSLIAAPEAGLRLLWPAIALLALGVLLALGSGELLDGQSSGDTPAFDQWLARERQRIASATVDALRRSVLTLAPADPHRALRLADRALAIEPFDDSLHELVVDIQVSGGDRKGAWTYVDALRSRYRAELGIEIPERIRRPLERPVLGPANPLIDLRRSASALLELAHARMRAGDYPDAIEAAQRAAADGAASGDAAVERAALTTLASVLIHSVRGRDDEATRLLERALRLAQESGDQGTTAEIERELGYRWAEALILTDTVLLEEACDPGRIAAALALTRAAPLEAAHQRDLDIEATEGVHFERAWLDPVRYRVLQDGSSHPCDERLARSRDVVDGVKEFAHAGHHRELLGLARGGETLVEGADPGVAADRGERRHPERMAQRGVAERMEPRVPGPALAGLAQAGDRADEGADGLARDEARGVSEHREQVR